MNVFNSSLFVLCARWTQVVALGTALGCSDLGTAHFKDGVNKVNQVNVAQRYGPPHEHEKLKDGRTVWIYFERGSATAGYSGFARSTYCRAYILTFDENEVLREWQEQDCSTHPAKITEPFSDRK